MIYSYSELLEMKNNGVKLNFDDISKEQLENLFINEKIINSSIAELYNVSTDKVRTKRRKWNISIYSPKYFYNDYVNNNRELFDKLNKGVKEKLFEEENIDMIAKALTHYVFRNGPVEDMHANKQLSQDDMKTLNKYMVNKIAGLLKLAHDGEWLKIGLMVDFLSNYGIDWDEAIYDTEDVEMIFNNYFEVEENK